MVNLQLDADEGIVLQAQEIERYGKTEDVIDELILTNKSLILIYEYKANRRAKAEQKVDKILLEHIKTVNGKPQVMRIDHEDYGDVMQILYVDGRREYFMFWKPKKDIPMWISTINSVIAGEAIEETVEPEKKEIRDTMASIRLDSVIASGFRIGRSAAVQGLVNFHISTSCCGAARYAAPLPF